MTKIPHKAKLRQARLAQLEKNNPARSRISAGALLEDAAILLQRADAIGALDLAAKAYWLLVGKRTVCGLPTGATPVEMPFLEEPVPTTTSADGTVTVGHDPDGDLPVAPPTPTTAASILPALALLGDIYLQTGQHGAARRCFARAAALDPDGKTVGPGGGAEKFLWLAQLNDTGGHESVHWFSVAETVLRRQIASLQDALAAQADRAKTGVDIEVDPSPESSASAGDGVGVDDLSQLSLEEELEEKTQKLASALCGIAEVYMTDLSFDDAAAETGAETAITAALAVLPNDPDVLQTVASVRISQHRLAEARQALTNSLSGWLISDSDDSPNPQPTTNPSSPPPPFPTRISLIRSLLETGMLPAAAALAELLICDDDTSVEAWYLGGWAYWLRFVRDVPTDWPQDYSDDALPAETIDVTSPATNLLDPGLSLESTVRRTRWFIQHCVDKYRIVDYEDPRLYEHAHEILARASTALSHIVGRDVPVSEVEPDEDGDEEWADVDQVIDRADEDMTDV